MKSRTLKQTISLLVAILMLLPAFAFGTVAQEQEGETSAMAEVQMEAYALQKAELLSTLEGESTIFNYVDKASFMEAGHVERLPEEEDLNSYVFRNEDGSKTVYFLDEDVKFVNAGGAVTEKKLELVALDGGFTTRSSSVSLALPTDLSRGITLAHGGSSISLVPNKASLSEAASVASASLFAAVEELENSLVSAPMGISLGRADYQNAFGVGTTLRYTPTLSGVKEDVILDRYRGKNSFSFTLNTGNLTVFEENGRYFLAESAESEEKIFIGETWVYDSADHFEKGTLSVTKKADGVYTLTIGASTDFLTDPDTVYPVYIDPSLTVNSGNEYIEDVTMFKGVPNINCGTFSYNTVGASSDYIRGRTAVRLPGLYESAAYQQLYSGQITSVEFCVNEASGTDEVTVGIYPLQSSTWTESGATWNNIGNHYGTAITTAKLDNSELAKFNITSLVQAWREIDNGSSSAGEYNKEKGFIMIAQDETTPNKQFYSSEYSDARVRPYVTMTYTPMIEISGATTRNYVVGETIQLEEVVRPNTLAVTLNWSSTNSNVVSVNSDGVITAVSDGIAYISVTATTTDGYSFSSGRIKIKVGHLFDDTDKLFIKNMNTTWFSGPASETIVNGTSTKQAKLINEYFPQWDISYNSSGKYYTIKYGDFYLGVPTGAVSGTVAKLYSSSTAAETRWSITPTASGNYKITSLVSSGTLCLTGNENSSNLLTMSSYISDNDYSDEWEIEETIGASIITLKDAPMGNGYYLSVVDALKSIGKSDMYTNYNSTGNYGALDTEQVKQRIQYSEIVLIVAHGSEKQIKVNEIIVGTDEEGNPIKEQIKLTVDDIDAWESGALGNCKLIVVAACECGLGGETGDNFANALINKGASSVIAFQDTMPFDLLGRFSRSFFTKLEENWTSETKTLTEIKDDISIEYSNGSDVGSNSNEVERIDRGVVFGSNELPH